MMKKSHAAKTDFYKCMLSWRNTPTAETGLSPAQRMFGRRTRTLLPTKDELLLPETHNNVKSQKENSRKKQSKNYNLGAKEFKIRILRFLKWEMQFA